MFKRLMERVDRMMGRGVIDEDFYEELEEALLAADTNVTTTQEILAELRKAVRDEKITEPAAMKDRLKKAIADRFEQVGARGLEFNDSPPSLFVFASSRALLPRFFFSIASDSFYHLSIPRLTGNTNGTYLFIIIYFYLIK
jgi:hypothetical protein